MYTMNKKDLLIKFINELLKRKLMTEFIRNIFDYQNFSDYNYIFRLQEEKTNIIIDIYDNISDNRFNRYVFKFSKGESLIRMGIENNVFVTYINVLNVKEDNKDKLLKLAYLFNMRKTKMLDYANTFLNKSIVLTLKDVLDK